MENRFAVPLRCKLTILIENELMPRKDENKAKGKLKQWHAIISSRSSWWFWMLLYGSRYECEFHFNFKSDNVCNIRAVREMRRMSLHFPFTMERIFEWTLNTENHLTESNTWKIKTHKFTVQTRMDSLTFTKIIIQCTHQIV